MYLSLFTLCICVFIWSLMHALKMRIHYLHWYDKCDHTKYFNTESWILYNISREFSGNGNWQNDSRDQKIEMVHGFKNEYGMLDDFPFLILTSSLSILHMIWVITLIFQTLSIFHLQINIFPSVSTPSHYLDWKTFIVLQLHLNFNM